MMGTHCLFHVYSKLHTMVNQNPFKDTCGKTIDYSHPDGSSEYSITQQQYVLLTSLCTVDKKS